MALSRRLAGSRTRGWAVAGGVTALVVAASVLAAAALAARVARMVLVPPTTREEDTRILSLDRDAGTITLSRSADAVLPGHYSFWFSQASGHARLGAIVRETADSVTREILGIDFGDLDSATAGRFNGWVHLHPAELGVAVDEVEIETELGPAPAWLVPARAEDRAAGRWVIQVHGRAALRAETIRAVPVFSDAGYTSLLISYRNDVEAPASADGRYALGDAEWRDVEAAMAFALASGARELVLMGWSMGGATVLQALTRSPLAVHVRGLVLESPVVDWVRALDFQGRQKGLSGPVRSAVYAMMGSRWGRVFTGLDESIDLSRLDFVRRAAELAVPTLILHSDDDGFVPSAGSHALAEARPDLVRLESFTVARHTKLWNYDPQRWNRAITEWLGGLDS